MKYGRDFITVNTAKDPSKQLMNSLLGVFQKLLSSKVNDYLAFYLLQSIVEYLPPPTFEWALPTIFRLIFQRIQGSKTGQLVKSFIVFLSVFMGKQGPDYVISHIDSVQQKYVLCFSMKYLCYNIAYFT